jgi:hypothetical protein
LCCAGWEFLLSEGGDGVGSEEAMGVYDAWGISFEISCDALRDGGLFIRVRRFGAWDGSRCTGPMDDEYMIYGMDEKE